MVEDTRKDHAPQTEPLSEEELVEKIDLGASLKKQHKEKKPANRIAVIAIAAVCVVLAACAAIFIPKLIKRDDAAQEDSTIYLTQHTSDQITSIEVDGENKFTLTKDEAGAYHMSLFADDQLNTSS